MASTNFTVARSDSQLNVRAQRPNRAFCCALSLKTFAESGWVFAALLPARLQGLERLLDQLAPQLLLCIGANPCRTWDVHNAVAQHDAIGSDHFSDGNGRSNLNCRNTCLFQFGGNRISAARAGPSC